MSANVNIEGLLAAVLRMFWQNSTRQ